MLVSIVIPTFNRGALLDEALASTRVQEHRPLEVVVVDDCSTDDTAARVAAFRADVEAENFKIISVMGSGAGSAAARSLGFQASSGDAVLFLDSDDVLTFDGLPKLVAELKSSRQHDFAYGRVQLTGESLESLDEEIGREIGHKLSESIMDYDWHTMGALYRSELVERVDAWRDGINGSDDWVFQSRIKLTARSGVFVDAIVGLWRQHDGLRLGATSFRASYTRDVTRACEAIAEEAGAVGALPSWLRRKLTLRCLRHVWELGRYGAKKERHQAMIRCRKIAGRDSGSLLLVTISRFLPTVLDRVLHRFLAS